MNWTRKYFSTPETLGIAFVATMAAFLLAYLLVLAGFVQPLNPAHCDCGNTCSCATDWIHGRTSTQQKENP